MITTTRGRTALIAAVLAVLFGASACFPEPPPPTTTTTTSEAPAVPTITTDVDLDAVDVDGATVTVTGENFTTTGNLGTRPPLSGQPAGVYVQFGKYTDIWQPSAGAPGSARQQIAQVWALPEPSFTKQNPAGDNPSYALINADGSFEVTLEVAPADLSNPNYGIVTFPGGGSTNPAEELFLPVTFVETPRISVDTDLSAVDPEGETVTVTGRYFTTTGNLGTRPPLSGQPAGVYVQFGKYTDTWQPSAGAPGSARQQIAQVWALPEPSFTKQNPAGDNPSYALINADGSFEVTLEVAPADLDNPNYGIVTFPGGGSTNPAEELFLPLTFAEAPAE